MPTSPTKPPTTKSPRPPLPFATVVPPLSTDPVMVPIGSTGKIAADRPERLSGTTYWMAVTFDEMSLPTTTGAFGVV